MTADDDENDPSSYRPSAVRDDYTHGCDMGGLAIHRESEKKALVSNSGTRNDVIMNNFEMLTWLSMHF